MSKRSLSTLLFLSLILAACIEQRPEDFPPPPTLTPSSATQPPPAPPTENNQVLSSAPFSLDLGRSVAFPQSGLTIKFESVERDGRCPSAVICSENGPVVVVISASMSNSQTATFTMNPDPQLAQLSGIPPNTITYQNYEIELVAVVPYPEQPEDLMNLPYVITLIVREGG
jgi:hypothetical protein